MSQVNRQQDRDSFLADIEQERDQVRGAPLNGYDEITQRLVDYCYAARAHMAERNFACREQLVLLAGLAWRTARELGIENELPY